MTTLRFACPECCHRIEFPDAAPGRTLICPGCQTAFEVDGRLQPRCIPDVGAAPSPDTPAINEVLWWLDLLERLGWRMIGGIGHFLSRVVWEWLWRQLVALGRVALKASRVLAVFACWSAITFVPLALVIWLSGSRLLLLPALAWTALTLAGSVWGALYLRRRGKLPFSRQSSPNGPRTPVAAGTR